MSRRDMSTALPQGTKTPEAVWRDWNVSNAVTNGYKASGWVYRSINMIAKNASCVPWHVVNSNTGEPVSHQLNDVLSNPNPEFSRQDFFELLISWQQLSGESYIKTIAVENRIVEMWPISPSRITPIASTIAGELISGYEIETENGSRVRSSEFNKDNIISCRFIDPAEPMRGIGPLQAAAKAVDIDVDQMNFNKSAMQNRGVLEGIFAFKERIDNDVYQVTKQRIKEMFGRKKGGGNERDIGVIGSNAVYQRLSLTPAELDFLESRKFSREEIFIIFGIPLPLAGVSDSTTYNNITTARVIFWESTLVPILEDLKNSLNHYFKQYLPEGLEIDFDLSQIAVLRKDKKEQVEIAKLLSEIGVPVSHINELLTLGIPEYPGWDQPVTQQSKEVSTDENSRGLDISNTADSTRRSNLAGSGVTLKKFEERSIEDEIALKEKLAVKHTPSIVSYFNALHADVEIAMVENRDIAGVVSSHSDELQEVLSSTYIDVAGASYPSVLIAERSTEVLEFRASPELEARLEEVFLREQIILTDLALINKTTVESIIGVLIDGEREGKTIQQMQAALVDTGTFSPARALRIARTASGTAQSVGQLVAGEDAGARVKVWHRGGFDSRRGHIARNGEEVPIDGRFSKQYPGGIAPRYPLDHDTSAADRVNCTCSMSFR